MPQGAGILAGLTVSVQPPVAILQSPAESHLRSVRNERCRPSKKPTWPTCGAP